MFKYETLKPEYSHLWSNCKLDPHKQGQFQEAAEKILQGKSTYEDIQNKTGVPWYFVGLVHLRESDCNFHTHLHNGDPLYRKTYHVPAGRPPGNPPFTFEYSAIDALKYEGFIGITDWCAERIAYCLEQYNGWGYRYHGVPSAYLWAGTNNYTRGKYVADNVWSSSAVDTQLGAMGVLKALEDIDSSVQPHYNYEADGGSYKANPPAPNPKEVLTDSRKWNFTVWKQRATVVIGGTIAAAQGFDVLGFVKTYGVWLALGAIAAYVIGDEIMKYWMKQDVSQGRSIPSGSVVNVDTGEPV